jgi:hypothetical protein
MASILGPPYRNVEIYIPQVVEDLNPKVPDWHWENMPPRMTDMIDEWVKSRFDKELQEQLLSSDMLKKQKIDDIEIDPSEIVKGFLEEINDSPSTFLNTLFINPNDPNILHIDISNFQIRP